MARFITSKKRTPSALVVAATIIILSATTALAQDASVVYLEGEPELRTAGGSTEWLDFGSTMIAGDSVVTGRNDFVELEQGEAATIRVEPNTVFTIKEVERNGRREQVMSTSVGSVGFRFNRLAGRDEPRIGTSTVVAGIRGTEVVVYAGANGSSLFLVETGEVAVTSAGETVSLVENEGVEVPAGGPPGEKFEWLGQELDFSEWEAEKFAAFLSEPLRGVAGVQSDLYEITQLAEEYYGYYEELNAQLKDVREQLEAIEDEDEFLEFRESTFFPVQNQTGIAVLNYRYHALSALSLRRYVLGRMYLEMKTRFILNRDDPTYVQFVEKHNEILDVFEERIVPYLVDADI